MEQKNYRWQISLSILISFLFLFMAAAVAHSAGSYLTTWSGIYPSSTSDNASCLLCHATSNNFLNPYGKAICDQAGTINQRIAAVENANSDTDPTGSSNLTEINANAQPGWTTVAVPTYNRGDCSATGSSETAAQAGVSGLLDPAAATTTTTLPQATTTTLPPATTTTLSPASTTTTTLPPDLCPDDPNKTDPGVCGCGRSDADTDLDGIEDCLDNAPYDSNPDQTDTDGDGVGDAAETLNTLNDPSVASLTVNYGQDRVTLTAANNSLENVTTLPTDEMANLPAGVTFSFDLLEFSIITTPGGVVTITLELPVGEEPASYWKYGPTPDNTADHWYEFLYDGTTGAEFNGNIITLHFVEGERGDDDLDATNGIIFDLGGPAIISADSSSASGCFIATAAYGSYWESHVMTLRQFRDSYLLTNTLGTKFVEAYYRYSPPMADYIAEHDGLRSVVRIGLAPLVGFSWLVVNYGIIAAMALLLVVFTMVTGGMSFIYIKKRQTR